MSGGHFDYNQYRIQDIADGIERLIANNEDDTLNEFGDPKGRHYPPEVIERFKEAAHTLRQAAEMAQQVDWLVSDDYGPESFLKHWEQSVPPYYGDREDE